MLTYLYLIAGLLLLIAGGNYLVKGGVAVAKRFKVPTLIIGMTIVAFGTSSPEFIVSLQSALQGHPEISIGNVVGSNIANIGLILGITALILPMAVNRTSVKIDVPFLIFCSLLFFTLAQDNLITRGEGLIFVILLVLFTLLSIYKGKKENPTETPTEEPVKEDAPKEKELNMIAAIIMIIASCAALTFGANLLIDSAVSIAKDFGVSERVISVTLVAFGTSVPELATSIMAAIRKENDIAIGNVVGSNIFNILFVIGGSALITPIENFDFTAFSFDFYWMIIFTAILALTVIPFERIAKKIKDEKTYSILTRFEGFSMIAAYIVYVILLLN
jgi:cation:H+ antiporter